MEIECKSNRMVNQQFDKMSRLEFVAIQFGVKFTITYKLRYYLIKTASYIYIILHYSQNFVILCN